MTPTRSLNKIKNFLKRRYKQNLAAILIFGSAATNNYKKGKSDIDAIVLLKSRKGLDFKEEIIILSDSLQKERLSIQYLHTLQSIKEYIKKRKSWATFLRITSKDSALVLYSTKEFQNLKKCFLKNPLKKKDCIYYLNIKQISDVEGYFKTAKAFFLTKSLMFHIRKQLQILNYLNKGGLVFDYKTCLNNSDLENSDKHRLITLYTHYKTRKPIREKEYYFKTINKLNRKIKTI